MASENLTKGQSAALKNNPSSRSAANLGRAQEIKDTRSARSGSVKPVGNVAVVIQNRRARQ